MSTQKGKKQEEAKKKKKVEIKELPIQKKVKQEVVSEKKQTENTDHQAKRCTLSELGKTFSDGADEIAEIVLDKNEKEFGEKANKIKNECVSMFKNAGREINDGIKKIKAKEMFRDFSYQLGRSFRITKDTCSEIFNDLME